MNAPHWPKEEFDSWDDQQQKNFLLEIASFFPRINVKVEQTFSCSPLWGKSFVSKIDLEEEWVFFGGTFEPWHEGHTACLKLLSDKKIVVVPDRNPWKISSAHSTKNLCHFVDELCVYLDPKSHALYPGFLGSDQANPTIDWFSKIAGKKSLLIGADNLTSFSKWKDYQTLLKLCHCLYVAPRMIEQGPEEFEAALEHCRSVGARVVVLDHHDFEHLSSTQLRQK